MSYLFMTLSVRIKDYASRIFRLGPTLSKKLNLGVARSISQTRVSHLHCNADFDGLMRFDHAAAGTHEISLGRGGHELEGHGILRGVLQHNVLV